MNQLQSNVAPFFYHFTSDNDGTYYGTNVFPGMKFMRITGDATYTILQLEIHQYIKNGHAIEMFNDDPAGNFPWLYFNFSNPAAEEAFLKTYEKYLKRKDIRSV